MRAVLSLMIALGVAADAAGETRTTTQPVTLRKKPGEKSAAAGDLPANTVVTIVRTEGRWFFVKAGSAEGYLTRTTVDAPANAPAAPVWSTKRSELGRALLVETATDSTLHAAQGGGGTVLAKVARGETLTVEDAASDTRWVRVRDRAGHSGWIARADVRDGATGVQLSGTEVRRTAAAFTRAPRAPLEIAIELVAGYRTFGMDLTSNVDGGLTNYLVDSGAASLAGRAVGTRLLGGPWFAGADLAVAVSQATPGIEYPGPTSAPGKIPFRTFLVDAGVRAGFRAADAFYVALRAGAHYDAFLPRDVENVGMLPRERLFGVAAGLRVDIVPPHSRISAGLRLDVIPLGSRAQTPGLEDGTDSTARAAWGGMSLRVPVTSRWFVTGDYEASRAWTRWSGRSVRQPGVTSARREDAAQVIQLGIGAEL